MALQHIPTMEEFPDTPHPGVRTSQTSPRTAGNTTSLPPKQTMRVRQIAEQNTPQKKRLHSGEWKSRNIHKQIPPVEHPQTSRSGTYAETKPSTS